jgi:hypothetical protein
MVRDDLDLLLWDLLSNKLEEHGSRELSQRVGWKVGDHRVACSMNVGSCHIYDELWSDVSIVLNTRKGKLTIPFASRQVAWRTSQ